MKGITIATFQHGRKESGMTKKQIWDKANDDQFFNLFFNLYCRWQDEKEYEDIRDYLAVIKKKIPEARAMRKSPFGFIAEATDGKIRIFFKRKGHSIVLCAEYV